MASESAAGASQESFQDVLVSMPRRTTIELPRRKVSTQQLSELIETFKRVEATVKVLDLEGNAINDEGATLLVRCPFAPAPVCATHRLFDNKPGRPGLILGSSSSGNDTIACVAFLHVHDEHAGGIFGVGSPA